MRRRPVVPGSGDGLVLVALDGEAAAALDAERGGAVGGRHARIVGHGRKPAVSGSHPPDLCHTRPTGVRVELADGGRVVIGDHAVGADALGGRIARRVLAVLALERRPLSLDELGDAVWGEALPRTWTTALRGAVHRIRRALDDGGAERSLRTAFGCYQLDPAVVVDVVEALRLAAAAGDALDAGDASAAVEAAGGAVAVLSRPILADEGGEWFERQRRALHPSHVDALLTLSAASTAFGDHRRAVGSAATAVDLEPFSEATHRQLMAAHAGAGDRAAALLAYRRCRQVLADELGVDPSVATEAVRRSVLAARDRSSPRVPLVLPPTLARPLPLVGRAEVVDALTAAWRAVAQGGSGAAVVAGAAGVGKSRLAAEVAAAAHRDGAAVVHGRFDLDDLGAFGALGEVFGQLGVAWPPPELASADRDLVLASATEVLASAAAAKALVVVLDDVHWADRPSLTVLEHLAGGPPPGPPAPGDGT